MHGTQSIGYTFLAPLGRHTENHQLHVYIYIHILWQITMVHLGQAIAVCFCSMLVTHILDIYTSAQTHSADGRITNNYY